MAISVPQMQTAYTGYDFGQNTARNLLDAVRMRNQRAMQDRKLKSEYELQQRRLRSAEGMQDKSLNQSQDQFKDTLAYNEKGQEAGIKSRLAADAIAAAQEGRTGSEFEASVLDRGGRSDILREQSILENTIDNLEGDVTESLNNPNLNVKTINKDDSILTKGANMFNKQAYNLYNSIYPSDARDRYSQNFGLDQAVSDRSNTNYFNDPNIIYTQDVYESDRNTPNNLLNLSMLNNY